MLVHAPPRNSAAPDARAASHPTTPSLTSCQSPSTQRAVQMPIAIAHHHAIGLDHQHAGRGIMLVGRRLVHLLDVGHRAALLAFQFRADAFGLRAQRLAAHRDPGQFRQ